MANVGRKGDGESSVSSRHAVANHSESSTQSEEESSRATIGAKRELKEAYTQGKRNFEIFSLSTFLLLMVINVSYLFWYWKLASPTWVGVCIFGGILCADFLSGVVHWLCDSYGSVDMPVFGKAFIRSFREHHVDPTAITHHDVIECNADSCMTMLVFLAGMTYNFVAYDEAVLQSRYHFFVFLCWLAFFIAFTNQFHKWSHTYGELPRWVEILQDMQIILPKRHHKIHHVAPHATYFCITTGWLNHPLEYIGFWPAVEKVIEVTTGYRAREDDLTWANKPK